MKKLLFSLLFLVGCASNEVATQTVNSCQTSVCQPATASYTVREPVKVVYRNTTYSTVYVPKTYKSVNYEERPYNCVRDSLCK